MFPHEENHVAAANQGHPQKVVAMLAIGAFTRRSGPISEGPWGPLYGVDPRRGGHRTGLGRPVASSAISERGIFRPRSERLDRVEDVSRLVPNHPLDLLQKGKRLNSPFLLPNIYFGVPEVPLEHVATRVVRHLDGNQVAEVEVP